MLCWGHGEPCEESSKEEPILGGSFWLQDEGGWEPGETGGQPGIVLRPCAAGIGEEETNSGSDLVKVAELVMDCQRRWDKGERGVREMGPRRIQADWRKVTFLPGTREPGRLHSLQIKPHLGLQGAQPPGADKQEVPKLERLPRPTMSPPLAPQIPSFPLYFLG